MDVSDIISEINGHGFEDTSTEDKVLQINKAVWDVQSRERWPFLEKTVALNTDGSSPTPTNMPSDFKRVIWVYDTTNGVTIWPERLSTIRDLHGYEIGLVGEPIAYYFLGSSLRFWPVPASSTGRFQLDYFATQPELTDASVAANILLPPEHHEVYLMGALWRLYKREDDPENAAMFQTDYENKILQMREDLIVRQVQRSDRIYVTDEYDEADWY